MPATLEAPTTGIDFTPDKPIDFTPDTPIDFKTETAAPAASPDKTFMSQMAVEVPKVMSELEIDFPKTIEGLSPSETEYLNSLKKKIVLDEASKRVNESGLSKVARGAQQFTSGAVQSLATPEGAGLVAASAIAPPVGAGLMAGLAAKTIGEGAGRLSVPGGGTSEVTQDILNMALMTLGAKGSAALLKQKPTPEVSDASKIGEAEKVYGDVQPLEKPAVAVPVEEGGPRVQLQGQAQESALPLKPTVTETTPPVPASEMPKTPSETGLYPAVREVGGKVDVAEAGTTHPQIIKEEGLKAEDIDQRGFVDEAGEFKDREQAAAQSGVPTEHEPGRQHSTDLPEAQETFAQREARLFHESQLRQSVPAAELPKPTTKLPDLVKKLGRNEVNALLGEWEDGAELSADGKYIKSWSDPRNPTSKSRVPATEFLSWYEQKTKAPTAVDVPSVAKAKEEQLGGGAAHVSEFPVDPGDPDIYGIAARVREQRAKAGQTIPIEPGQGVSAIDAVIHGQEVLEKNPLAAEQAVDAFKKNKAISYEGLSATRARAEKEFQAARKTEEKLGTDSPEYQTAFQAAIEWDKASKEMQTEWHKAGRAQQGQTDLDTGTFTGLQRAFVEETGKPLPETKVLKAKKTAKQVGDAREASAGAKEKLFTHIRETYSRDPEQAAFDAAKKTVREWAVTRAEAESALRVAQKVQADAVKKIQDAAAERARRAADKTITANAKRLADEETAKRVREAKLAQETADVEVRRQQKRAEEAAKRITQAAAEAAKAERKLNVAKADLPTYVWTKAREYIEKGMDNFDDIRVKIATDEGLPLKKVTEAMGKDRKSKFLADEVWRKQQTARRLHEQAKRWLIAQTIPAYKKWLQNIPAGFFTAKVMGHGTVALGTHAPMGLFKPLEYGLYFKNFGRMYRMVFDPAFYENQVQDLLRNPNYTVARRAGLVNDPYQFEDYNSPDMLKWMGKATAMGNRGYAVLKFIRQDMFDRYWNKLPKTSQIQEVAEAISDSVNHATGVVKVHAPKGAAVAFFAPRLELSRAAWLAADPLKAADTFIRWKTATEGEKRFALMQVKEKAWVFGTGMAMLALNQGILTATGSKQKINGVPESLGGAGFDPMRSDFLKFKALGMQGSYGNAMTAMARLPARLFVGIENEGKFNKIVYEDENVASILFDFTRSQMSPFMGTATDLAIGRDFQRRPLPRAGFGLLPGKTNVPKRLKAQGVGPYTWAEYISVQATPIPASEAIREVWKYGLGMTDEQIASYMKAFAILSIMTGTGARVTEDYNIQK